MAQIGGCLLSSACFHQVEVPAEEAEEHDAHHAAQHADEDHHALYLSLARGLLHMDSKAFPAF